MKKWNNENENENEIIMKWIIMKEKEIIMKNEMNNK